MKVFAVCALAGVITLVNLAGPVLAQGSALDSPTQAGLRIGPLLFAPAVRLSEFGFDSNVYNRSDDDNPVGDFASKLSPSADVSLRSSHLRVSGRSQFDLYYYKTLTPLNAVDSDNGGKVDLLLNRLTLSLSGGITDTRHRQTLEIDAIAKLQTNDVTAGASVRLTGKTSVEISVHRSRLAYAPNFLYLDTDLAQALNHTSSGATVGVRYAVTPLTTFAVLATQERSRFDSSSDLNSSELRITPAVEFSPFALINGRASIGYYRRTFSADSAQSTLPTSGGPAPAPAGVSPPATALPSTGESQSTGTIALVDLNYTLLGRTRFAIEVNRSLEYSYLPGVSDYVATGVTGTVTQRLGDSWDVIGRLGRARLSYRLSVFANLAPSQIPPDETVITSGVDLGYNVGRTRIGLYVDHNQRDTDMPVLFRGYRRLRIGSSATYVF